MLSCGACFGASYVSFNGGPLAETTVIDGNAPADAIVMLGSVSSEVLVRALSTDTNPYVWGEAAPDTMPVAQTRKDTGER